MNQVCIRGMALRHFCVLIKCIEQLKYLILLIFEKGG